MRWQRRSGKSSRRKVHEANAALPNTQKPMKYSPFPLITLALVLAVTCPLGRDLQAQATQSSVEITTVLTTGYWHFAGTKAWHVMRFNADGTFVGGALESDGSFRQTKGWDGTWKITLDSVVATYTNTTRGGVLTIHLPVSADGTPCTSNAGPPTTLICSTATASAAGPPPKRKKAARSADTPVAAVAAVTTPPPPISQQDQQAASAIIQAYHDSLVFVTGADAAGSGFIASISNGNFLVTNAHVTAGIRDAQFKSLDGTVVRGGTPSIAVGEDIFCMSMPPGGKPMQVMQNVDENAAIGDSVVVLGNAEGGGVVNTIIGKIVGIGPNLVEVDAPFVPGNSGSPIVHLKTGKVIGVATYTVTQEYDLTTDKKLPQPVVRRFGYRIDSVKGWQAVNWQAFDAQAAQMESIEKLTADLADFFQDISENNGVVTMGRHTNPIISTRIDDWVAAKSNHPSAEDVAEADANFLSFLKIACKTDVTAAQSQITYDYFLRELTDQKQARDEMSKGFEQIIEAERQ